MICPEQENCFKMRQVGRNMTSKTRENKRNGVNSHIRNARVDSNSGKRNCTSNPKWWPDDKSGKGGPCGQNKLHWRQTVARNNSEQSVRSLKKSPVNTECLLCLPLYRHAVFSRKQTNGTHLINKNNEFILSRRKEQEIEMRARVPLKLNLWSHPRRKLSRNPKVPHFCLLWLHRVFRFINTN